MSLLLSFIPVIWLSADLQAELLHEDGYFDYYRFWNPDVRVMIDDHHLWCWNGSGIKFSDQDVLQLIRGQYPSYKKLTMEDIRTCRN